MDLIKNIEVIPDDDIDQTDITIASVIGDILYHEYPGYSWWAWSDHSNGVAGFRCGEINVSVASNVPPNMMIHLHKTANHKALYRKVIRMGGELLERAGLSRIRWNGDYPVKVDGLADRHQPLDFILKQINMKGRTQ